MKLNGSEGSKDQYIFFDYGAVWLYEVWEFEFHQPVFKKCNIGWPQQPPTENVQFSFTHFNMRHPVNAIGGFPLLQGKNSNKSKIKLFLSQNFPPFFHFLPCLACSVREPIALLYPEQSLINSILSCKGCPINCSDIFFGGTAIYYSLIDLFDHHLFGVFVWTSNALSTQKHACFGTVVLNHLEKAQKV